MIPTNFEALKRHFEGLDEIARAEGRLNWDTEVGMFMPAKLVDISQIIERLIEDGTLDLSKPFLDAGSGDGRIMALAALYGFPQVFGVEYDPELVNRTENNIRDLRCLSIINGIPIVAARGDFREDGTYARAGIRFEDIGTFFNYINNQEVIAAKIAELSPPGTRFVLYGVAGRQELDGLVLEGNEKVIDLSRTTRRISVPSTGEPIRHLDNVPYTYYFSVYRKP